MIPRGRLRRLGKVVGLSARVGSDLVGGQLQRLVGKEGSASAEVGKKIVNTLGEMKGVAQKAGQMLSLAAEQLPGDLRARLTELFTQAPPLPYPAIAKVVETELGAPPEALFADFEHEPFAAASLGQVHRATTRDGQRVAVKVQYPDVAGSVHDDLRNMAALVKAAGLGRNLFGGEDYFAEVRHEILLELDYRRERQQLDEFRILLSPFTDIVVPRALPALSAARVLTLELLSGETLVEYTSSADEHPEAERFRIATQLMRAVYGPFLAHGVIHADTHPGNFIVLADGRLGVLDFGSIKRLSLAFWRCYREAMTAALRGEHPDLLPLVRAGGFAITLDDDRARALLDTIAHIVGRPLRGPYDFGADSMVGDLVALKRAHMLELLKVRPPPEAVMFFRAVAGMSHNLRQLQAAGDFRPVLRELLSLPTAVS